MSVRLQHALAGHEFDQELSDDALIMDAIVILRLSTEEGPKVQLFNTTGTDMVIRAGLLAAAHDLRPIFFLGDDDDE